MSARVPMEPASEEVPAASEEDPAASEEVPATFAGCPPDILEEIAAHAGPFAVGVIRRVCRHWHSAGYFAVARSKPFELLTAMARAPAFCNSAEFHEILKLLPLSVLGKEPELFRDSVSFAVAEDNIAFLAAMREHGAAPILTETLELLATAVAGGNPEVFRVLATFGYPRSRFRDCLQLFMIALLSDQPDSLRLLAIFFKLNKRHSEQRQRLLLFRTIELSSVGVLRALKEHYNHDSTDIDIALLLLAKHINNGPMLQCLAEEFGCGDVLAQLSIYAP